MRKLMKLMTITAITSISTIQVVACKDDSLNEQFLKDVNDTERNHTAFFGFLGSADNDASKDLQTIFDYLNKEDNDGNSFWKDWKLNKHKEIAAAGIEDISLNSYQGPAHDPVPSDPIGSFWNEKNITWQKNIFNWVYDKTKTDSTYHTPWGFTDITEITTVKDGNDKDRFQNLPIIFIVKEGHLITAGENWLPESTAWQARVAAVGEFVLKNLLSPN